MTAEAALTKLSYLLATNDNPDQIRKIMKQNIRGELTTLDSKQLQLSLKDSELLRAVSQTLSISSSKVSKLVISALSCSYDHHGHAGSQEAKTDAVPTTHVCCCFKRRHFFTGIPSPTRWRF